MKDKIRILSTKKISENQKQHLLNVEFLVNEIDLIRIQNKSFEVNHINEYLIFTSQNAVESVLLNEKTEALKTRKCFCVGIKTKALLEQNQFEVLQYSDYASELASVICNQYSKNSFTFFCGNLRRDVLPEALRLMQIELEEVEVYETILTPEKINFKPDGILFFSPSAVESYLKENEIKSETCFCIGNTTAEALRNITVNKITANKPTIESVIMKCIEYYKN